MVCGKEEKGLNIHKSFITNFLTCQHSYEPLWGVKRMGAITKEITERLAQLTKEEQQQVLNFTEFLVYHRERIEDAALARHIKTGLSEEFLTVNEAREYLKALKNVADKD